VTAKIPEKLYQSVSSENGLRELGITDHHEEDINVAKRKFEELPIDRQNSLRHAIPQELSQFLFYKVLVSEGEEVTITGSVKLTKDGNTNWQKDYIPVDPFSFGDDFIAESKLQSAHKLDDPRTKETVQTIIQVRKDFVVNVDKAYDKWKFDEAQKSGIDKAILGKPLQISDVSVDWIKTNTSSALGKFTVNAKTTEKLYQSVVRKAALEKLGIPTQGNNEKVAKLRITEIFEEEIDKGDLLKQCEFYDLILPSGSVVTLTGTIELTKPDNGDWQVMPDKTQVDPFPEDRFIPNSRLQNAFKLDELETKRIVETHIKNFVEFLTTLITQKDNFDKFCGSVGTYNGSFDFKSERDNAFARGNESAHSKVSVRFDKIDANNPHEVTGVITFRPPNSAGDISRPFFVGINTLEMTKPVTGKIDNAKLPTLEQYLNRVTPSPQAKQLTTAYWNVMDQCTVINIQFTNKMEFFIHRRPGFNVGNIPLGIPLDLQKVGNAQPDEQLDNRDWVKPAIKKWGEDNPIAIPKPMQGVTGGIIQPESRMPQPVGGGRSRQSSETYQPGNNSWQPGQENGRRPARRAFPRSE
jgi:hypothetical protein